MRNRDRSYLLAIGRQEIVGTDNQAAVRPLGESGHRGCDVGSGLDWQCHHLDCQRRRGGLDRSQEELVLRRAHGVEHQADTRKLWRHLLEQADPFAADGEFIGSEAGDVSARMSEAVDESLGDRIRHAGEHNRNGAGCLPRGGQGSGRAGNDHIGVRGDEPSRCRAGDLGIDLCPAVVKRDVLARSPAETAQHLLEGGRVGTLDRVVRQAVHEDANPPHPIDLLRARCKRPCRHAADQGDELAPPQDRLPSLRTED